jgi:hypothetical protein
MQALRWVASSGSCRASGQRRLMRVCAPAHSKALRAAGEASGLTGRSSCLLPAGRTKYYSFWEKMASDFFPFGISILFSARMRSPVQADAGRHASPRFGDSEASSGHLPVFPGNLSCLAARRQACLPKACPPEARQDCTRPQGASSLAGPLPQTPSASRPVACPRRRSHFSKTPRSGEVPAGVSPRQARHQKMPFAPLAGDYSQTGPDWRKASGKGLRRAWTGTPGWPWSESSGQDLANALKAGKRSLACTSAARPRRGLRFEKDLVPPECGAISAQAGFSGGGDADS